MLTAIADTLFPLSCVGCGASNTILCKDCLAVSSRPIPPFCPLCESAPGAGGLLCNTCNRTSPLLGIVTASNYKNPITRTAIQDLKFNGIKVLAHPLALLLADAIASSYALDDSRILISSIPLHTKRARQRGFDQSSLLARALGKLLAIPITSSLISRQHKTAPQHHLRRDERQDNVRDAFVAKLAPNKPPTILLIDDVITTGATMEEAAQTLKNSGWKNIWGIAVARAELQSPKPR